MATNRFPYLTGIALILAASQGAVAQGETDGLLSFPACDRLIDESYDRLSNAEKSARLTSYGSCWKRKVEQILHARYREATTEVRNFRQVARHQAHTQVRELGSTEIQLMRIRQQEEMAAHREHYASRLAALQAQPGDDDYRDVNQQRSELTTDQRAAFADLQRRQKEESTALTRDIRDSYSIVDGHIDQIVHEENRSLAEQLSRKLAILKREFENVVAGSFSESVNDTLRSEPIGEIAVVTGNSSIRRQDETVVLAQVGTPVFPGDELIPADDGTISVDLIDDSRISLLGTDGSLTLDEDVIDHTSNYVKSTFGETLLRFVMLLRGSHDKAKTPVGGIGVGIRG